MILEKIETVKPITVLYWKLAFGRATGKAAIAIALSIAQGLNGVANWSDLTRTQQFVTFALAIGAGWAVLDAFLDTTMAEIRKHKDLTIPNGQGHDTEVIKRNAVEVSTTETIKPAPHQAEK